MKPAFDEKVKREQRRQLEDYLMCGRIPTIEIALKNLVKFSEQYLKPLGDVPVEEINVFLCEDTSKKFYMEKKSYCVSYLKYCGLVEMAEELDNQPYVPIQKDRKMYISRDEIWRHMNAVIGRLLQQGELDDANRYDTFKLVAYLLCLGFTSNEILLIKKSDYNKKDGTINFNGQTYFITESYMLAFIDNYLSSDGYTIKNQFYEYIDGDTLIKKINTGKNKENSPVMSKHTIVVYMKKVFDIVIGDIERSYRCWKFLKDFGIDVEDNKSLEKVNWEELRLRIASDTQARTRADKVSIEKYIQAYQNSI